KRLFAASHSAIVCDEAAKQAVSYRLHAVQITDPADTRGQGWHRKPLSLPALQVKTAATWRTCCWKRDTASAGWFGGPAPTTSSVWSISAIECNCSREIFWTTHPSRRFSTKCIQTKYTTWRPCHSCPPAGKSRF